MQYKFFQYPRGANKGGILNTEICPTISTSSWENNCLLIEEMTETQETATTICLNSKIDGKQPSLEHRIYDCRGIATAITTDYHPSIAEVGVEQIGNIVDDTNIGFKNPQRGRIYSVKGISPALNCCGGGGLEPKIIDEMYNSRDKREYTDYSPTLRSERSGLKVEETKYRIRKLTPRECFRLMGVDDANIDTIQASGISNSQQYKLAGNSIVVDNIYHIFRKMFVKTTAEHNQQLTLF